jgi:hypothetical protein
MEMSWLQSVFSCALRMRVLLARVSLSLLLLVPIPAGTRDLDMLASAGVASRAPRLSPAAAASLSATGASAPVPDFPVSVYTQLAARGLAGMTASAGSANPFQRNSRFTRPVGEHSDMIDEPPAWATEETTSLAVHAGGELTLHEILERLRAAIKARGGDNGIKTLTRILKRMDSSGDGLVRSLRCLAWRGNACTAHGAVVSLCTPRACERLVQLLVVWAPLALW